MFELAFILCIFSFVSFGYVIYYYFISVLFKLSKKFFSVLVEQ